MQNVIFASVSSKDNRIDLFLFGGSKLFVFLWRLRPAIIERMLRSGFKFLFVEMLFAKGMEMERCEATVANKGKEVEEECAINHWTVSVCIT